MLSVSAALALVCGCGSAAGSLRPQDQRLAARIAPRAVDLGPAWRERSAVQVHARVRGCRALPQVTGCAFRFFALPDDPRPIPSADAIVQIFPSSKAAAAAYAVARHGLAATRTIGAAGVHETISLVSQSTLALGTAHATLIVDRVVLKAYGRHTGLMRSILMQEGRAELLIAYKTGRTADFPVTAPRLALRMRPARP